MARSDPTPSAHAQFRLTSPDALFYNLAEAYHHAETVSARDNVGFIVEDVNVAQTAAHRVSFIGRGL